MCDNMQQEEMGNSNRGSAEPSGQTILNRHCAIAPFDCSHGGVQGLQLQAQKTLDKTTLEMGRQDTNARARGLLLHFIEDPSPWKFHARAMKPHGEIICQESSQEIKTQGGKPEEAKEDGRRWRM